MANLPVHLSLCIEDIEQRQGSERKNDYDI